jgi:Leucine-rich repeat (LRR) protein
MNHNIICLIADKLNFIDKQHLKHVCSGFYQCIKIKVIPIKYSWRLTNRILRLYRDLEELDIPLNSSPSSKKRGPRLFNTRYESRITQSGIKYCTKLKRLNALDNHRIRSVNHMKDLRELCASYNCGINDEGIKECLQLERLDCSANSNITSVNHLTSLKRLGANRYGCGLSDKGIENCRQLIFLSAACNEKISIKKLIEIDQKYHDLMHKKYLIEHGIESIQ